MLQNAPWPNCVRKTAMTTKSAEKENGARKAGPVEC